MPHTDLRSHVASSGPCKQFLKRVGFVLLAQLAAFTGPSLANAGIDRVLPFATDKDLRIEIELGKDLQGGNVTYEALIAPAGKNAKRDEHAKPLWSGKLEALKPAATGTIAQTVDVSALNPNLWSPGSPSLYFVTVEAKKAGRTIDSKSVRFGFRSFTNSADGQFLLNGHPIFLRGVSIGPPGRGLPEETTKNPKFAYDYVKFMKSQHLNLLRFNLPRFSEAPDPRDQAWFDACDEYGVMVYQGNYGAPPEGSKGDEDPEDDKEGGKGKPPANFEGSIDIYKRTLSTYVPHPSIVIYILANELPGPILSKPEWHDYLVKAHAELKAWDPTRLFICNAGYGLGREGEVNDVHRYWGWYYNSFLTYYNLRQSEVIFGKKGITDACPFTFSECVGSFTSVYGQFNHTFRKQLGAAQAWTGHSYDPAEDALAYQAFMVKQALESFRTMREVNPKLAGLMPFTILFYNWNGVKTFDQMKAKPAMDQMGISYQPVLVSLENWTPNLYTGSTLKIKAKIVNDADDFSDLTGAKLKYDVRKSDKFAGQMAGEVDVPAVKYFGVGRAEIAIPIADNVETGEYVVHASLMKDGKEVSSNETPIFIAKKDAWAKDNAKDQPASVTLYDPSGKTAAAFKALGINADVVKDLKSLNPSRSLVIGELASDASIKPFESELKKFIAAGGRVLVLGQDKEKFEQGWLPVKLKMFQTTINDYEYLNKIRPTYDHMNVNPERHDHPVFRGIDDRDRLHLWNDYTNWDVTKPGFPAVYPVGFGFKADAPEKVADQFAIIADYDRGLEGVAVAELFDKGGKGSVVVTAFDLVRRIGNDPVADRMLSNLVAYLGEKQHDVFVTIDKPIKWGDYSTEKGVITGPQYGLVENCRWLPPPLDKNAKPLKDNTGAWNVLPGDQFIPIGRRPWGPWEYNNNTAPRDLDPKSKTGEGFFYATLASPRKAMLTKLQNTGDGAAKIDIEVNGTTQSATIEAGKTITIRNPVKLKAGSRDVEVRIKGDKDLVMLETAFQ